MGHLGVGAYATVEHCRLINWRDDSHHGGATAAAASAAASAAAVSGATAAAAQEPVGIYGADGGAAVAVTLAPGLRAPRLRQRAALDVAVKYLRAELFTCPGDLEDFVKEAVLLAGLQHRCENRVWGLGFLQPCCC